MDFIVILQAGVASGTILLFATIGELLAERSGILNLGVEGMMLIGAMSAYSIARGYRQSMVGSAGGDVGGWTDQPGARRDHHQAAS